jgi:predicted O-methyltransferase YrrM
VIDESANPDGPCSLHDPRIRTVLDRLHSEAKKQTGGLARLVLTKISDRLAGRQRSVAEETELVKDLYIPLSPKQGTFVYMVARSLRAQRIVEFGTSFGISTLYLAAAVRDNGGGTVIGSEFEPSKVAKARSNIEEAGLSEHVEIREGDAIETLKDPGGTVDMLLLDGMKEMYIDMVEMLKPHLRQGAVVIADNILSYRKALAPFVAHMQNPANGFQSVTLLLGDGTAYSIRL